MKANPRMEVPPCDTCGNSGKNSLLCSLSHDELSSLTVHKSYNIYKKNQIIFYEGNQPQGLFCIFSGKVKVHKLGEEGREQIVRFAKQGNVIGYRALLSGDPYYASATALENTMVCFIPKTEFLNMLQKNHALSSQAIRMLTNDLKFAEQKIMNMAQKQVRDRVAEALLMVKECYGLESDNKTINSVLTRRDIASIAGTTTETAIRTLADLNREKIIGFTGKKIRILKMNDLVRIANIID